MNGGPLWSLKKNIFNKTELDGNSVVAKNATTATIR
jgi:hypothetical protein